MEAFVSIQDTTIRETRKVFDDYPIVACLDDSIVNRKMMQRIMTKTHCSTKSFVHGTTMKDIKSFVQKVVSFETTHQEPVDVCIVDQNLDDPDGIRESVMGTDVIGELKRHGFTGKCFIRSANDNPSDVVKYLKCGAGFISKTINDAATFVKIVESPIAVLVDDIVVECDDKDLVEIYMIIKVNYTTIIESYNARNFQLMWNQLHQLKGDVMSIGLKKLALTCEAFRHLGNNAELYVEPMKLFTAEFTKLFHSLDM